MRAVARRNSGKVRYDSLRQKEQHRQDKRKKFGGKRNDRRDWTDKLFAKLEELKTDDE
jgi:hypothetical protein